MNKQRREKIEKRHADETWSSLVKSRDNDQCIICGKTKYLNAHHLISRTNKELRFDVMNGVSLCPKHHRFSFDFSAHQNPFVFILWLMKNRQEQFEYLKEKV